jgi:hypothetical protein
MLEEQMRCKSGALTLDGSNSSNIKRNNSSTGLTRRLLISMVEEMKKEEKLSYGATMERQTRDGLLSILTKLKLFNQRDL